MQEVPPLTSGASSPETEIPQELTDMVLDLLSHDLKSLRSCSLVARQWRPRSQYHLHRSLKVCRQTDIKLLASIYQDELLASYVRTLDIERMWSPFWDSTHSLLQILGEVRSLSLVSVGDINQEMRQFMAARFTHLRYLSLSFVTFDTFAALTSFLNAFPALTHLSVKNVYWSRKEGLLPDADSLHRLRDVSIGFCTDQHLLLRWLAGAADKPRLESLAVTWYEKSDAIREFMHCLGPHLQRLTFSYVFSDEFSRDWREHPLDLSSNTGLRELEFGANVMLPYVWGSLPTIPEMVASSGSACLQRLSIHLTNLDEEPVPSASLSTIDDILSRPQFRSVEHLNLYTDIKAGHGSGWEQCMERIVGSVHRAVPKTLQRGILHIGPSEK
ncbi:hypothetical protein EIP91_010002 [Steccherinum ochraceum]|uniref:F-box domain-containing protein n=1 Tax=Steccherinum ochraceum TaxID=92696 RepID=A0A4R0RX90_9APHY|nr:hypothetical protein EIP91_010002 [Steccherinum ochraceum]